MAFYFGNFVFSLAINFDWWHVDMNTVSKLTMKQQDMKHIMNTSQHSMLRQIQMICHVPNTFRHYNWPYKTIQEFPCPMQPQVLYQQQNLIADCIFNITVPSISVLLLICLRLQQTMLHQLTKFLPTLYLVLRSLNGVQTIQVVHRHAQGLSKRNMCW